MSTVQALHSDLARQAGRRRGLRRGAPLLLAGVALLALAGCERRQAAVLAEPLLIPINLKCTTCNDFIRCTSAADGGSQLLRLEEMTFWAQAGTIFDYMFQVVRPWTEAERPLTVYREGGASLQGEGGMVAHLDTVTAAVTTPLGRIDQRTGAWTRDDGTVQGSCVTVPRREGFRIVRQALSLPMPRVES